MQTIKNRTDFLKIAKSGQKWVAQGFIIQAMPNDLDEIRVGYTVTKKTDQSSVKRNRIKRRLRSIAREILTQEAKNSYDFVLIGKQAAALRSYDNLRDDLRWCLKKLNLSKVSK